jgi:hypothetical protein
MSAINNRSALKTDPIRNFRFLVEFLPHDETAQKFGFKPTLGFTSVSGLAVTTESIPYREGGYNSTIHQIPGQSQFSPITLQRGLLLGTPQHWNWMKRLFSVTGNSQPGGNFRCDLNIYVLAHPSSNTASSEIDLATAKKAGLVIDDRVHQKFRVYNTWPTSVAYSDLNAGDNALVVEQMTLVHEGFDMVMADDFNKTVKNTKI